MIVRIPAIVYNKVSRIMTKIKNLLCEIYCCRVLCRNDLSQNKKAKRKLKLVNVSNNYTVGKCARKLILVGLFTGNMNINFFFEYLFLSYWITILLLSADSALVVYITRSTAHLDMTFRITKTIS